MEPFLSSVNHSSELPNLREVGGGLVTKSRQTLATPWTVACQAPLSMGFSRQEYWSGLPFPFPGDLPNPGIELMSPALQADSLLSEPPGKPRLSTMFSPQLFGRRSQRNCTHVLKLLCWTGGSDGKKICLQCRRPGFDPWVRKIPWRRK